MSEEWRTLPEFPKYEITSDGDVRHGRTKKKLKEVENKKTGAYSYSLRRNDGTTTCRSFWGLVYSAFPELDTKPAKDPDAPKRKYSTRGHWVDIPGFPTYQAHPTGIVRYKASRKHREIHQQGDILYVKLYDEYGRNRRRAIYELMAELFPQLEDAA